ncbi:MAG: hypothetical protein QOD06_2656 [Candidatus Binatota bacterium]|nr:hypothetical protein [Candidatus Binatota bacterium]
MRGLVLEGGCVVHRDDLPRPDRVAETRVRVLRAGICSTDLALLGGYMGFRGTPGHEFVGEALDGPLAGERVVGEINAACGACEFCLAGLGRHCPSRTVLGILGRAGAFAEELSLPEANLHRVPDAISTDAAVFVEPLAAAFEIAEQVPLEPGCAALVAGDGKIGLLCAWVLHLAGLRVTVAGRHDGRRRLLPEGVEHATGLLEEDVAWHEAGDRARFDLAVEATGRPECLGRVIRLVRPRGTIVLKTTSERATAIDLSPAVVHELTLLGSRCGRFEPALDALARGAVPVESFVEASYPLAGGADAFARAASPGTLKVLLDPVLPWPPATG